METYNNILSENDRIKVLKFIKSELQDLGPTYPCLQTKSKIHFRDEMKPFVDSIQKHIKPYEIIKCWGVCSLGNTICWHNHPDTKYSLVYYLHNPTEDGTMFLESKNNDCFDTVKHTNGIQNSMIRFENFKLHSTPLTSKKVKRYTIALDIM
tara:strand:- start:41 stop:496 length:456 start_codon:yes stop_codon:yes gene_type:complete